MGEQMGGGKRSRYVVFESRRRDESIFVCPDSESRDANKKKKERSADIIFLAYEKKNVLLMGKTSGRGAREGR